MNTPLFLKSCSCCVYCRQSRPCDGVLACGPCDNMCTCDENAEIDDCDDDQDSIDAYVENNWFRVEVADREGAIVSIEPGMLAGRDIGDKEKRAIIEAVKHLSSFVGDSTLWE